MEELKRGVGGFAWVFLTWKYGKGEEKVKERTRKVKDFKQAGNINNRIH